MTIPLSSKETSAHATRYVYYRMFSKTDAIDSAHPFVPSEPNLSRLPLARFPPPHTTENVLARILRNENSIPLGMSGHLYDCQQLDCLPDKWHVRITESDGPGSSIDKALMCRLVDLFDELCPKGWYKARAIKDSMDYPLEPSDKYLRYKSGDTLWVTNEPCRALVQEGTRVVKMAINPGKDPRHQALVEYTKERGWNFYFIEVELRFSLG